MGETFCNIEKIFMRLVGICLANIFRRNVFLVRKYLLCKEGKVLNRNKITKKKIELKPY